MTDQKTFEDARPDVMGLSFELDEERFAAAKAACGMSPEQTVVVKLVELPESDIKGTSTTAAAIKHDPTKPDKLPELWVPVQDRLDFTEKSILRVNRSLVQSIRVLAARKMFTSFYQMDVAGAFLVSGAALVHGEAYEFAREYIVDRPDHLILTPSGEAGIETAPETADEEDDSE